MVSLSFGIFLLISHREINLEKHFSNAISEKNIVQGIVSEKLKSTAYYDKFILKTNAINSKKLYG